ncbi:hypothetical protein [Catellatospora citrea]|uniref:Uncharacterized protein n=1 Tax=Catellatospora citrea TaxID=53366 RepID=A0A8J3NZE6_9ACTN|nr:hypothetical protein [Catellatospora citrea]RKE05303.1 hypothetical protein C8E86_0098 [Catellatospora citrea]GIF98233.1 hypothetical protein Cci01nite_33270 [Catellatospora citrea]
MTGSPTNWVIADGSTVSVGHHVRLDIAPGSTGEILGVSDDNGLPEVRITAGPGVGGTIHPWPGQMLGRIHNQ